MKSRTFYAFAAVTAVLAIAAIVTVTTARRPMQIAIGRDVAFPDLTARLNDAAEIAIRTNVTNFTIRRVGEAWGLAEKDNYPVSADKVKAAIVKLAEFRVAESKTNEAARHERLHVDDVSGTNSKAKEVTIRDAAGKALAATVIGRRNSNLFGALKSGTYYRKSGDNQVWLAEGEVDLGAVPNDWMERVILDISSERVKRVSIQQPDGEILLIRKDDAKDRNFTVEAIPAGRKLASEAEANPLGGALWRFELDDVKRLEKANFPDKPHAAEFTTFEGVVVKIETAKLGEEYWARISASALDPQGEDDAAKEKVRAEAKTIADRAQGWAYRLSIGDAERMTKKKEELLAKPEDEKKPS